MRRNFQKILYSVGDLFRLGSDFGGFLSKAKLKKLAERREVSGRVYYSGGKPLNIVRPGGPKKNNLGIRRSKAEKKMLKKERTIHRLKMAGVYREKRSGASV